MKLKNVLIVVKDIEKARRFYHDLFGLPLTLTIIDLKYSGAFVSTAATFAAIQEGHLIRSRV
jgi:catechol 2,3-dioxygenase-like lactoylglutathione lyase family enzyme